MLYSACLHDTREAPHVIRDRSYEPIATPTSSSELKKTQFPRAKFQPPPVLYVFISHLKLTDDNHTHPLYLHSYDIVVR